MQGVDEVGVGALAGPVIAAAVILAPGTIIKGLADSKLLTAKRRQALFAVIRECAVAIGVGRSEVEEVDRINVYWAAMEARRRAVEALRVTPGHVLVDGKRRIAGCRLSQTPVVGGDALCASIAAASIVAKVTRDSLMGELRAASPWIRLRTPQGLRDGGPYPCARTARSAAASSLLICARVDSGRRATAARALGWPTAKGEKGYGIEAGWRSRLRRPRRGWLLQSQP